MPDSSNTRSSMLMGAVAAISLAQITLAIVLAVGSIGASSAAAIGVGACAAVTIAVLLAMLYSRGSTSAAGDRSSSASGDGLARVQRDIADLANRIDALSDRLPRLRPATPNGGSSTTPGESGAPLVVAPTQLDVILRELTELRMLSLLTDEERRDRTRDLANVRKLEQTTLVVELIEQRQWGKAEALLAALEAEFPGDGQLVISRRDLFIARMQTEAHTVEKTADTIESHMSVGAWDQAYALSKGLAADYPGNVRAQELLNRVIRERDIIRESTAQRMYEEIRHDVERRMWRKALVTAERMLEKFPDHRRADAVRQQLATIQDNAEIEQRQEEEVRIGELIRGQRFAEAVQLSEDLLKRFPMSPQAESLEQMLPRLRALAEEQNELPV